MIEPEALPEHIGPYRVTGRLGRGGMGEVLRGHDDRLDRPVALKRVRSVGRDPEKARRRFRREARVVARLSDPAIVPVYDWVEAEGHDWLVMELVDGRSLDQVLADGPLVVESTVSIARQIASGLATAHEAGLVHRDLKPGNVMVTAVGDSSGWAVPDKAKILDFGIAKEIGLETAETLVGERPTTLTQAGELLGTVAFMSPEQALGWPVDHRSDLFSLGTLLYEMLCGVSPFEGDSAVATLSRICSAKEQPLSELDAEIPEGLARLVGQLLEKEPARRPANARQVVAELDRLAAAFSLPESGVDPRQSGSQDETLIADIPGGEEAAPLVASTGSEKVRRVEELSDSYAVRKLPLWWGAPLAVVGVLVVVGLWGFVMWMRPPAEVVSDAGAPGMVAQPPAAALSSHQLFQRGMTTLERYDRKGNIDKAIADFQRALALDESSASAHAGLARAYWLDAISGSKDPIRLEQASAAAERAVALDEYLALARISRGLVRSELGLVSEAVQDHQEALTLEPLNADAHYGLGLVYEAQGKLPAAEEQYRLAIQSRPDRWIYYSWLGTLCFNAGRYQEAEEIILRSIELAPDNFMGLRNLGVVHYMQGKLDEAATEFQKALQIQPEPSLYANLGTLYFAQGLYTQAVTALEKAIEVGGGSNEYRLWGNLGDAYRWAPDRTPQAEEAYLRAIQLLQEKLTATPDVGLQTRLALYLAKRGDLDQALAQISAITDPPSDDVSSWFRLAIVREICGQRADALAALRTALQAGYSISEVQRDPELLKLRQDARYHRMVMKLEPAGGA